MTELTSCSTIIRFVLDESPTPPSQVNSVEYLSRRFNWKLQEEPEAIDWTSRVVPSREGEHDLPIRASYIMELLSFGDKLPVETELSLLKCCARFADHVNDRYEVVSFAKALFTWANEAQSNPNAGIVLMVLLDKQPTAWSFDRAGELVVFASFCRTMRTRGGSGADFAALACLARCKDAELLLVKPDLTGGEVFVYFAAKFTTRAAELLNLARKLDLDSADEGSSQHCKLSSTVAIAVITHATPSIQERGFLTDPAIRLRALYQIAAKLNDTTDFATLRPLHNQLFDRRYAVNSEALDVAISLFLGDNKLDSNTAELRLAYTGALLDAGDLELSSSKIFIGTLGIDKLNRRAVEQLAAAIQSVLKEDRSLTAEVRKERIRYIGDAIGLILNSGNSTRISVEAGGFGSICDILNIFYQAGFPPREVAEFIRSEIAPRGSSPEHALDLLIMTEKAIGQYIQTTQRPVSLSNINIFIGE